MRLKYIIAGVIALAGILFGAWNWINYFQDQNEGGRPVVQATRPPQDPEIARLEQEQQQREQQQRQDQGLQPGVQPDTQAVELALGLPDTVGRNPFLRPAEIEAIASGEYFEQESQPSGQPSAPLPELKISAVMQDNVSGNYVALIDGKSYREGDTVGAERIVEIDRGSVVLETAGRMRTLSVGGGGQRDGVIIEMRQN